METWYAYFASQKGSIGYALRVARQGSLTFEAEQRALLGIPPLDHCYDRVWLHLQGMSVPRRVSFKSDTERIAQYISSKAQELNLTVEIDAEVLQAFLTQAGPAGQRAPAES